MGRKRKRAAGIHDLGNYQEIREMYLTSSGQDRGDNVCRLGLKPSRTVKDLDEFRRVAGHLLGGPINHGPSRDR